jgi:hypothetical protein
MRKDFGFSENGIAVDVSGGDQALSLGCRALYIGGAGDLAVTMHGGTNLTFVGLSAGTILPIDARTILQTGTTATAVVALL